MGKEHWVVCKVCGEKFDVSRTKTHFDGTRYTCSSCLSEKEEGREIQLVQEKLEIHVSSILQL